MTSGLRSATAGVLGLRIAYGAALLLRPEKVSRRWLGSDPEHGATRVALRGLGMREVVLHVGAALALIRQRPMRPWLLASIAGDVTDVSATLLSGHELPSGSRPATFAVGGGAAAISLALAAGQR